MKNSRTKTYVHRVGKTLLWVLAGILGLMILVVVALQLPGVQRYIVQTALSSISKKSHSRIDVGSVNLSLSNSVVLRNIFVESRHGDTLLFIQSLAADVNLLKLFHREIDLRHVRIDSLTTHISRTSSDSGFNFDFLLEALDPQSTSASVHPDPSPGPGWKVQLGGLSLNGLHGTYDDEVNGLHLRVQLGTLEASISKFEPDSIQFYLDNVTLANTTASVIQTKTSRTVESQSRDVEIGFRSLSMANLHMTYDDRSAREHYSVDIGNSTILAEAFDLPSHRMAFKNVNIENTDIAILEPEGSGTSAEKTNAVEPPWVVSVDNLILGGNSVRYDVEGSAPIKGVDPQHLRIDGLIVRAKSIYFSPHRMSADIGHASFRERSGLEVHDLSGGFVLDSLHVQLKNFTVETAGSHIRQNTLLQYSSLAAFKDLAGTVNVTATVDDSRLSVTDLLLFLPSFPIRNTPGASIRFSVELSGLVRDLRVGVLRLGAGDSTTVELAGSIHGLPETKTASYDLDLRLLSSGRNDIHALIADSILPGNIVLPASIRMSGKFTGTLKNFSASTILTTSIGSVMGNVTVDSGRGTGTKASQWKADVTFGDFNVGSLLNEPQTFGPVSLTASAAGTGLTSDDIEANVNVQVDKAVVNGYSYRGLSIQGTAGPHLFQGKAEIQDSSIAFTLNGTLNTSEENPRYKFTLDLKGADLRRLKVTPDDVRLSGIITSDLSGKDINDISGTIDARHIVIIKERQRYVVDSLVCSSVLKDGQTHISIESPVFSARFDGTIAPGELPEMLKDHLAHYFALQGWERHENLKTQAFTFHLTFRDPTTLTALFVPELHRLSTGTIEGSYSSDKKNLNATIDVPRIDYGRFTIDSLVVRVSSDADLLHATMRVGSIADSTLRLTNLQFAGKAGHDSIDVVLESSRTDGFTNLRLAGVFQSVPEGYTWRFNKNGIVFQNLQWDVPSDNYLRFGKDQLLAHDVVLRGAGQSLSLQSTDEKNQHSPMKIEFADFDLATLSHVVERDSGLVGGVLNGNVVLRDWEKRLAFTSDLTIKDFTFGQSHVGDVAIRASSQTDNVYEVHMEITGNGNQIALQGEYQSEEDASRLDLTCDFTKVNLASIEPFTFGKVHRLSGTMTGGLHVTGTTEKPSMTGELNFTRAAFTPTFLDSYLHLEDGKILFDGTGVEFRSFDLADTVGNIASLRGHVYVNDFRTYSYDLRIHTDKFLLLNKPANREDLYYGTVILSSDISILGDQTRPKVTMQAELDKGTNLALVLPESELAVEERRGIVRFVDAANPANSIMSRRNLRTDIDTTEVRLSSMDLTSNISVNKESKLRILIDPVAGDSLVIQGEATFSFAVDPSGKITLTGRYDILEGSYRLSFGDFIKREFAIAKGSSLTWFGSPYEADVDITAIYTVKASVLDLIQDQLAGISQEERNKYKQELPIQIYLMMKGKLLKPDIHFKLDLPPDQRGVLNGTVYAKLNELNVQESELNKQVFALLVLGRFISENPLASVGGNGGLSDLARSSVSQILSTQLNRLSEQYLAGASLNVGVESYQDYSTGTAEGRTQLKLALSKQLFDERVTVQVGGNVDLEGRRSQENSLNNFAGDLNVLYKLTEDGRWQLQVFRQNSYEGAIDGDITKTGVGIVFTIDFDRLFGITLKPIPDEEVK